MVYIEIQDIDKESITTNKLAGSRLAVKLIIEHENFVEYAKLKLSEKVEETEDAKDLEIIIATDILESRHHVPLLSRDFLNARFIHKLVGSENKS